MKKLGLMCAAILSLVSCSTTKPSTSALTPSNSSSSSSETVSSSSENKSYFSVDIPTIAHRGYHTTEIENTEGAFLAAAQRNFVGIETDIYWTKDGYIICNHDTAVNYYGKLTPIKDLTYQEIMDGVNLSGDEANPVRVTTFNRFLEICRDYNKIPVIEFKITPSKNNCEFLIYMIQTIYGYDEAINDVYFISFGQSILSTMMDIAKENAYSYKCYLLTQSDKSVEEGIALGLHISHQYDLITQELADKVHDANLELAAWTCNYESKIAKLKEFGCVTVTTDVLECDPKYCK